MKKLMTMIAAVATAFGLYAADVKDGTSFEGSEAGVSGAKWTQSGVWSSDITDAFDLGAYDNEKDPAYTYGTKVNVRRNSDFIDGDTQNKYLKLETGSATLNRTIGSGQIYVDQLVKFTGFEEEPKFTGNEKIAVWASAIEADDTVQPVIVGDTNLYVAVGTANGQAPIKNVKINVADNFDFNAWHRLTIKQLDAGAGTRAGFLIWIDGNKANTSDKYYYDEVPAAWSDSYTAGELFLAMDNTSAAVSTVSYKGIGAIDDVVVSATAPDFDAEISFAVTLPDGVEIVSLVAGGKTLTADDYGKYWVMPNAEVTFNLKAADGYRLDLTGQIVVKPVNGDVDLTTDLEGKVVVGYATYNGAIKGEAELAAMMAGLTDGDEVAFIKGGTVTNSEKVSFYTFTTNTQIAVANGKWTLTIGNDDAGNAGTFGIYKDIANDITVAFAAGDTLSLGDGIAIAAGKTLDASDANGSCVAEGRITVAGTLKGVNTDSLSDGSITLDGAGSVWSATQLTYKDVGSIFTNKKVAEAGNAQSGYTYTIKATEYVAQIGEAKYETLAAAFAAAQNNDTVEMLDNVSLAANEKIVIMNKAVTLAGAFTVTAAGRAFNVQQGGTLTISSETTVIGTGTPATIFLWPYDFDSRKLTSDDAAHYGKAKLVVNGTVMYTTTGNEGAISSNGNDSIAESKGVEVIINGTVINECDSALYLPGKGTCTVNDGAYIEGTYAGIQMKAVTLTVNGGTIKATSEDQTPTALWANGAKPSGCAIQMEGNKAYAGGINLTVNGGTIESVNAKAIYAYGAQEKFGTISIAGGTIKGNTGVFLLDEGMNKAIVPGTSKAQFNQDVTAFCEEGYETVKLESAEFYTVRAKQTDPIPPLPDNPTADDVNAKVDAAKFADSTVKTMIGGDSAKYTAFKTWADMVTGGQAAVVASAHAADSYLLGQTTLLENAPVSEIKTIAKTSDTALTLTFEIKDGANAVTVAQTATDYVKGLVQCNEKVDFGNGTKIDATVTVTINGQTLTAAVTLPPNKPAAFMKVAK